MKEIGFSLVRYWIFWSDVNPGDSEWNWGDLDQLFDLANEVGIGVVAQLVPESQPNWFVKANPDLARLSFRGAPSQLLGHPIAAGGRYPGLTWDHKETIEGMNAFTDAVVERYREHPALHAWDVWNEVQAADLSFDSATKAAWNQWLRKKYADFSEFRGIVKSDFQDVEDVPLLRMDPDDKGRGTAPLEVIFQRWQGDRVTAEMARRADRVRALDRGHPVASHRGPEKRVLPLVDEAELAGSLEIWGASNFNTQHLTDDAFRDLAESLASLRGAADGKTFWLAENGAGGMYHFYGHHLPFPEEIRTSLLLAYAHGADSALFWQYRHERFGHEASGWGLVNYDGSTNARVAATVQMAAGLKKADPQARRAVSPIGILYDPDVLRFERTLGDWVQPGVSAVEESAGWYAAALEAGISPDIYWPTVVAKGGLTQDLRVLVLPMHAIADPEVEEAILRWVEAGGTVLTTAYSGMLDERFIAGRNVPSGPVGALLGARVVARGYPAEIEVRMLANDARFPGHWVLESLEVQDASVEGLAGDMPVVTVRKHGKGYVRHIATLPGSAYFHGGRGLSEWVAGMVDVGAGVTVALPAGVFVERLVSPESETLCLFNPTDSPVVVAVGEIAHGHEVHDMWTDQSIAVSTDGTSNIHVGARDSAWLVVSRKVRR